jgi:DnaJ family protein C protein 13
MRAFTQDKDLGQGLIIAWNHIEFEVTYNCLADEIRIGEYYLRILLECGSVSYDNLEIKKPIEFFNDLYHRFLLTSKLNMKSMCLQAMTIVYTKCFNEIGPFNDTKYIVNMLERTQDRLERDRLLLFIESLILNRSNVKDILDANGIRILVDLITLAHLHTQRAYVPTQTNVIEASPTNASYGDSEKEWYYGNKQGPCSFKEIKDLYENSTIDNKTRLWAQGMDGWRIIDKIPQLKWCLMASGQAILDETQLATLILNIFIKICNYYPSRDAEGSIIRPLPRVKRMIGDQTCLPHVIQLLLTFDPIIVEKVAFLLSNILQDNPILSRIYMTGVFYFIVMYTGSNVIPISKFLEYTHNKQAFRTANSDDENENKSSTSLEIIKRSIMGNILPEAMICYLENHGHEKFSQIFLGEFDTPEVIWNSEMRRYMIEKVAGHLADFTPRLLSNTRALYQFCPIPLVKYKQLENELFCNIYYLKHLCDIKRFPEWPIKSPIELLKDCLFSWKYELEKKPSQMSREQALEILEIKEEFDDNKIRKAYFKLAQKYHPGKLLFFNFCS